MSEVLATPVMPGDIVAESYEIVEVLGVGGMGIVYKAVQRSLGRFVALKLPRPELAMDLAVRRRLRCEAIAGARDHRNIAGTPDYLAPEVIRGSPPGFAADVYAVGVMLYELVSGATPFGGGTSADIMSRSLEDDAVPLILRCSDRALPSSLDAVVMRALEKDPADRFVDAGALVRALDGVEWSVSRDVTTRKHVKTKPPIFSMEATTVTMSAADLPPNRTVAVGSSNDDPAGVQRRAVPASAAIAGDADEIIVSCLERARSLIDEHRLVATIDEVKRGLAAVAQCDGPTWRLWLMLAALCDGIADRKAARIAASKARLSALRADAAVGVERADALLMRLARRRSASRPPRPW